MKGQLKRDAEAIRRHLADLKGQPWLGPARAWWPDFLFRADHIEAAASILNSGHVLSRAAAAGAGVIKHDSASPDVIAVTAGQWKRYVRLYFRPRSPTQYASEGFRPAQHLEYGGAHCPAPVVFVLDAHDILTREDTEFSNGNLASHATTGKDAAFLETIPFRLVYHDGAFAAGDKGKIIFHRHAEVMVPDQLDLQPLRFVGCRTQAEYETLLHLLTPEAASKWTKKIGVGAKVNLHYRRWNYVEQVTLDSKAITFKFNPTPLIRGPFAGRVEIVEQDTNTTYLWEDASMTLGEQLSLGLESLTHPERYSVKLTLDGCLAYANRYFEDLPF